MYRDDSLEARVAQARTDQRRLINQWRAHGYTCTDTYAERLRCVLASALDLPTYAGLYERQRHLIDGFIAGSAADTREIVGVLPLIAKPESRSISLEALHARRQEFSNYFETSGTTSRPTPAPKTPVDIAINTVNFGEHWREFIDPDSTALILINTPQGPAAFQLERALNYVGVLTFRTWVDTFRNDYGRVLDIADTLRPDIYAGPPSQLLNLYEYAAAQNRPAPTFKISLLLGERATPGLTRRLERLTRGIIVDASYGSSETGTLAVATGTGLRLQTQSFITELRDLKTDETTFVDDVEDASGELIVTQLDFVTRPLIRYATGDIVRVTRRQSGEHVLAPLGRATDTSVFGAVSMNQEQIEDLLWPFGTPARVFNYLFAIRDQDLTLLITAEACTDDELALDLMPLKKQLPGLKVIRCQELPATNGLGSALGWKASRVLDLRSGREQAVPTALTDAIALAEQQIEAVLSGENV
ncbi:hypothetical protein [Microbacterium lacticum]